MSKYKLIAQISDILEECTADELELLLIIAEGYHRKNRQKHQIPQ